MRGLENCHSYHEEFHEALLLCLRIQRFSEWQTQKLVSHKALRGFNSMSAQTVYPVFEDEKSKGSDEKLSQISFERNLKHFFYFAVCLECFH